jgi:hypothetical protein
MFPAFDELANRALEHERPSFSSMYTLESLEPSKIFFFTSKAGIALLGKLRPREIELLRRHTCLAPSAFQSVRSGVKKS